MVVGMYVSHIGGGFWSKCRPNWREIAGKEQEHMARETSILTREERAHREPKKVSQTLGTIKCVAIRKT